MFNEHEKLKLRHCTDKWKNSMEIGGMRVVGKSSWKEREVGKSEVGKFRCSWK